VQSQITCSASLPNLKLASTPWPKELVNSAHVLLGRGEAESVRTRRTRQEFLIESFLEKVWLDAFHRVWWPIGQKEAARGASAEMVIG
jgi:hypothetical protein